MIEGEVPFFSTPTLAKLMLKENYEMKNSAVTFQTKINDLSGIHRMAALVALVEQIFNFYQPFTPTIIKLAILFLTNNAGLTEDSYSGLDHTASIISTITDFITSYYQIPCEDLADFESEEIVAGNLVSRPAFNGAFETQPGYWRLCATRSTFTAADSVSAYIENWSVFWRMLKCCLCAGARFIPDVDLAVRHRIINGLKTHPLRQQFTESGLQSSRQWLSRYHEAQSQFVFIRAAKVNLCSFLYNLIGDNGERQVWHAHLQLPPDPVVTLRTTLPHSLLGQRTCLTLSVAGEMIAP